jgi:hypothetical protein
MILSSTVCQQPSTMISDNVPAVLAIIVVFITIIGVLALALLIAVAQAKRILTFPLITTIHSRNFQFEKVSQRFDVPAILPK